jgi:hypothetical protein
MVTSCHGLPLHVFSPYNHYFTYIVMLHKFKLLCFVCFLLSLETLLCFQQCESLHLVRDLSQDYFALRENCILQFILAGQVPFVIRVSSIRLSLFTHSPVSCISLCTVRLRLSLDQIALQEEQRSMETIVNVSCNSPNV